MTISVESDGVQRMFARIAENARIRTDKARGYGSTCTGCYGSGWLSETQTCGCDLGRAVHVLRSEPIADRWVASKGAECGIPPRYADARLHNIGDSPQVREVHAWASGTPLSSGKGIYMHGPFGRGKTYLLAGALHHLLAQHVTVDYRGKAENRRWRGMRFVTSTDMLQSLRPGNGDTDDNLYRYQSVALLMIDDIGVERLTDWGAESMFSIISSRHNALLPTLITSNYTLGQLAKRINEQVGGVMGFRITERLHECCEVIAFSNDDPNWRRM